ncbi:MAG: hypothetical protein DRR00_07100, partial [Candidatus Parabeggiatoa sp. nov. 3]
QLSKSSSHLKVTNMLHVFAKTSNFKWIYTSKKAQIIIVNSTPQFNYKNDANKYDCGEVVTFR